MSYDVYILDKNGETIHVDEPHGISGGTYSPTSTELWLNITFNYGKIFRRKEVFGEKGILRLQGLTVKEALPIVTKAWRALKYDGGEEWSEHHNENGTVTLIGTARPTPKSYWDATDGNAKNALGDLGELMEMAPEDATISISY